MPTAEDGCVTNWLLWNFHGKIIEFSDDYHGKIWARDLKMSI